MKLNFAAICKGSLGVTSFAVYIIFFPQVTVLIVTRLQDRLPLSPARLL